MEAIKEFDKPEGQDDLFYDLLLLLREGKIDIRTFAYMHHLVYACRRFQFYPEIVDIANPNSKNLKEALYQ